MSDTPNHGIVKIPENDTGWADEYYGFVDVVEQKVRVYDTEANRSNYDPYEGVLYISSDTGVWYIGNGSTWVKASPEFDDLTFTTASGTSVETTSARHVNSFEQPPAKTNFKIKELQYGPGFYEEENGRTWTGNGQYYSTDEADTWTNLGDTVPSGSDSERLVASDGNYLYAGVTRPFELYRADVGDAIANNTYNWTQVLAPGRSGTGFTTGNRNIAEQVQFNPNTGIYCYCEYGTPTNGPKIYRSTDGSSWSEVHQEGGIEHAHHIDYDPYNSSNWIVALGDSGDNRFLESTDDGLTWNRVSKYSPETGSQAVAVDYGEDYIYFSDDSQGTVDSEPYVYDRETGELLFLCSAPARRHYPMILGIKADNPAPRRQNYGIVHHEPTGWTFFEVRNSVDTWTNWPLFGVPDVGADPVLIMTELSFGPIEHGDSISMREKRFIPPQIGDR